MAKYKTKKDKLRRRHNRVRNKIEGTTIRPRICIRRSSKHLYAQLIDDEKQITITSSSTLAPKVTEQKVSANVAGAAVIGKVLAEKALEAGIKVAVFDRGGYKYHGKIKALADAAREAGLKI